MLVCPCLVTNFDRLVKYKTVTFFVIAVKNLKGSLFSSDSVFADNKIIIFPCDLYSSLSLSLDFLPSSQSNQNWDRKRPWWLNQSTSWGDLLNVVPFEGSMPENGSWFLKKLFHTLRFFLMALLSELTLTALSCRPWRLRILPRECIKHEVCSFHIFLLGELTSITFFIIIVLSEPLTQTKRGIRGCSEPPVSQENGVRLWYLCFKYRGILYGYTSWTITKGNP